MSLYTRLQRKLRRETLARTSRLRRSAKAAIIGCGQIAPEHIAGYRESGVATVIAISDIRAGALASPLQHYQELRAFRDCREMLEATKPDVVSICTWPQNHLDIVRAVLQHPVKGILCEKPMALRSSEIAEMLALCDSAGVKLAVGHQYRFHPYFRRAADLVKRGALGKILKVRGNIKDSIANNGPHLIDTVRFLLADKPVHRVSATLDGLGTIENRGWLVETGATSELLFDGDIATELSFGNRSSTFFTIEVIGDKASLRVAPDGLMVNDEKLNLDDPDTAWYWCRRHQFADFVRWATGARDSYSANGRSGASSTELVLALYAAGRGRAPIALPLSDKRDVIGVTSAEASANNHPQAGNAGSRPAGRQIEKQIPRDAGLAMDGGERSVRAWPESYPHLGVAEAIALGRVLVSRQLGSTGGSQVAALEKEFAGAYGAPKAVASTSGTAAIHVAVAAINPEPRDEIITTAMSDMGTVVPILMANCVPVFADIDPTTGNLTVETIAKRITPRTKAVIVVHLFGRPAELGPIQELLRSKGIALIEDCAQAHFAEYRGRKIGTFGDLGCFSLQQSKQITCGDGGLTLVNREDLIERASLFIDKGRSRKAGRLHLFLGPNYRMTELQAAVARVQLRRGPKLIAARRDAAAALTEKLKNMAGIILPRETPGTRSSWWLYNFLIDEPALRINADDFCDALCVEGIPALRQYLPRPLFEEDVIAKHRTYGNSGYPFDAAGYSQPKREDFPGLEEFFRRQIILAWNSRITPRHVDGVALAIGKLLQSLSRTVRHATSDVAVPYADAALEERVL